MSRIVSVATALPPYEVAQSEAAEFAKRLFAGQIHDFERFLPIFANAGIEHRYMSRPIEWLARPHTLAEKNNVYIESATELSATAAKRALEKAGVSADEVDTVIYVNSTGIATPSIDARIANMIQFKSSVRRIPVWGLGCAGGVSGIGIAHEFLRGSPNGTVLLIATELCGLTFIPEDLSRSNVVACALFGEGSAAVLLQGDDRTSKGVAVRDTNSVLYPDSLDVMGWNMIDEGMQVVFAQRIPDIVEEHARRDIGLFLERHDLTLSSISALLFHPGGTKVLAAYESALGLTNGSLDLSRSVLRDYGNMSSVTVLFVLERFLGGVPTKGDILMSALGPGFSSEMALLRC